MGVVIQKMVNPIISGVAFTGAIDTDGSDVVLIEATMVWAINWCQDWLHQHKSKYLFVTIFWTATIYLFLENYYRAWI